RHFLDADEEDRASMLAFIEGGGLRQVRELQLRHRDGTPTSADLEEWADSA
ncbi:hypothetical protein LCGC14_1281940, partial [marine sediment metagenome]